MMHGHTNIKKYAKSSITVIRLNYILKAKVLEMCFLSFMRVGIGNGHKSHMYRPASVSTVHFPDWHTK